VLSNGTCWNIKGYCGQRGFQEDIAYTIFFEIGYPVYQLTLHLYIYVHCILGQCGRRLASIDFLYSIIRIYQSLACLISIDERYT